MAATYDTAILFFPGDHSTLTSQIVIFGQPVI